MDGCVVLVVDLFDVPYDDLDNVENKRVTFCWLLPHCHVNFNLYLSKEDEAIDYLKPTKMSKFHCYTIYLPF